MTTEEAFLATLTPAMRVTYDEHAAKPDLGAILQNHLKMREYNMFLSIQVPDYPPFMITVCNGNHQQLTSFMDFVKTGRWTVCDGWMSQHANYKEDYDHWKALYIAIRQNANARPEPPVPAPRTTPNAPVVGPPSISIKFPSSVKKNVEGRGGITLRRIGKETKAKLQIRAVSPQQAEVVISSTNPNHIIAGCREVLRTLNTQQKQIECIYDGSLAKFVASWSKNELMLFQWRNSCSLIPVIAGTESNSMVMLKSWTASEKTKALIKLRELQKSQKRPSAAEGVDDLLKLIGETQSDEELNNIPEVVNILVLGETGVGKSTFLNAMINYLKYSTLTEAAENGPEIVVPTKFTYTDYKNKIHNVVASPKYDADSMLNRTENMQDGASCTQDALSYLYILPGENGKPDKIIRIIDTPGVGDVEGIEKDEKNFEKIMSYIADFPEIHGILLLLKPDKSRLTTAFKYCVQELLGRLHKSASDNVVFGFTHAKGCFFRPGASYTLLKKLLGELESTSGIKVPLTAATTYCYDSDSFLYLAGKAQGIEYTHQEKARYQESWNNSKQVTIKMFEHIYRLQPHDVNKTLCINNTKKVIQILAKPLGEITRNLLINQNLLQEKLKEITELQNKGQSLTDKQYWDQVVLEIEELESPQTVCTAACCVTHETVGGVMRAVPKLICDPNCRHTGIQAETLSNSKLRDCKAMNNGKCTVCGCDWQTHMHVRYRVNQVIKKVVNESVQSELNSTLSEQNEAESFIAKTETKIEELNKNKNLILSHSSEFALFVAESSLLAVNDAYSEYLKKLIHEEKNKASASNDDSILRKLEQYKETYEEQTRLLKKASETKVKGVPTRSVNEINKLIDELKALDICGTLLLEMQELEIVSVRSSEKFASRKVELTNWKTNLTWLFTPISKLLGRLSL